MFTPHSDAIVTTSRSAAPTSLTLSHKAENKASQKNIEWKAENRYTSFLWYPSDDLVVLLSGNQNKITKTQVITESVLLQRKGYF